MGNLLSGEEEPLDTATVPATTPITETAGTERKRKRRATPAVVEVDAHVEPTLPVEKGEAAEAAEAAEAVEAVTNPDLPTKDLESLSASGLDSTAQKKQRFNKTYRKRRNATTRKNTLPSS